MSVRKIFSVLCALAFFSSLQAQKVAKPVLIVDGFEVATHIENVSKNYLELLRNNVISTIEQLDKIEVVDSHNKEALNAVQRHETKDSVLVLKGLISEFFVQKETDSEIVDNELVEKNYIWISIGFKLSIINPTNNELVISNLFVNSSRGENESEAAKKALTFPEEDIWGNDPLGELRNMIDKAFFVDPKE